MSMVMDEEFKRWTAKRKTALVLEIIQGKTTVAEASRAFNVPSSEIEAWVDEGKKAWKTLCATESAGDQGALRAPAQRASRSVRRSDA